MSAAASLNVLDPRSFGDLKRRAADGNSPEALRAAAEQFEAVFMQMVFKAMRDATPQSGLFDSEHTQLFQQMHDQQLMSDLIGRGRGSGLADAIFRQLGGDAFESRERQALAAPGGQQFFDLAGVPRRAAIPASRSVLPAEKSSREAAEIAASGAVMPVLDGQPEHVRTFVEKVWDHAVRAGEKLGVEPRFVVAQAALETGWGRAELRRADGSASHNLFNIKTGSAWRGEFVELPVTEYAGSRPHTELARFRAYDSYASAFDDYVALLSDSPRYAGVLGQHDAGGFATALADAGYATDPHYAAKLKGIIVDRLGGPANRPDGLLAALSR